ncbi:unnamed protein product [Mycena citricolor]|uniref:Uncharacterized protein n=1 Tax=Mycena citricolor TaxID=2018698 RepID=A0AAD2K9B2_9AGAR|nr:unnamed protein product [Mycena citricolor]
MPPSHRRTQSAPAFGTPLQRTTTRTSFDSCDRPAANASASSSSSSSSKKSGVKDYKEIIISGVSTLLLIPVPYLMSERKRSKQAATPDEVPELDDEDTGDLFSRLFRRNSNGKGKGRGYFDIQGSPRANSGPPSPADPPTPGDDDPFLYHLPEHSPTLPHPPPAERRAVHFALQPHPNSAAGAFATPPGKDGQDPAWTDYY